jgi:hypothetical protein
MAVGELGFRPRDPRVTLTDTIDDLFLRMVVFPIKKATRTLRDLVG